MIWIVVSIAAVIIAVCIYVINNLLSKVEKYEEIIEQYETNSQLYDVYVKKLSEAIAFSNEKLKQIDAKESFKSDDEVGYFFENLKTLQTILDDFNVIKKKPDLNIK